MRSLRRCAIASLPALAVLLAVVPANAVLLSDLINPELPADQRQVSIGDKVFENFTLVITGLGTYQASAGNIEVTGIQIGSDYGLLFAPVAGAASIAAADAGAYVDLLIGFDAKVNGSADEIKAVWLSFEPTAPFPSNGLAQIAETVQGGDDQPVLIQVNTLNPPASYSDSTDLANTYSSVRVYKDIAVIGGKTEGAAITKFEQLFIQTPEPAAISLLALGSLALFGRRAVRRRTVWAVAVALGLGGLLMQPGTASAVLLSELVADPSKTVDSPSGNLVFSAFDFEIVGSSGSFIADPETIEVLPLALANGEEGVQLAGIIAALSHVDPDSSVTINLDYTVTVKPGAPGIIDVTMSFNGALADPEEGRAQVGKVVLFENASVGDLLVWNQPSGYQLQDHIDLSGGPYTTMLQVHDRIIVEGGESSSTLISFINQTFSVPEPAVLLMGLLGLPMLVRRRRLG